MKKILITIQFLLTMSVFYSQNQEEIAKIKSESNIDSLNKIKQKYILEEQNRLERLKNAPKDITTTSNGNSTNAKNNSQANLNLPNLGELYDYQNGIFIYRSVINENANLATRASFLNSDVYGINVKGQEMTAYIWDGGPTRPSHEAFEGRLTIGDGVTTIPLAPVDLSTQSNVDQNLTVLNSQHANHVSGTIGSNSTVTGAKGIAPMANLTTNEWNNDFAEMTSAVSDGMLVSNHSYGNTFVENQQIILAQFGRYNNYSKSIDEIAYNAPYYLSIWAAGNDGANFNGLASNYYGSNGFVAPNFDKLRCQSLAKNSLLIGSVDNPTLDASGNLISANNSYFSSQGPTDDLRIKPDLCGMGNNVFSTGHSAGDPNLVLMQNLVDNTYGTMKGTSMATPNVTGSLLLLQQYCRNTLGFFVKAATLKGLALHTADDIDVVGPDARTGWGLLNVKKAAVLVSNSNVSSIIEENTLTQGQSYSFTVNSDNINKLVASITWIDPIDPSLPTSGTWYANNTYKALQNDLDIRITSSTNTVSYPFKLSAYNSNTTGDNIVDPFEKIIIDNPQGVYTITVTHKGTLLNGLQNFSLIVSGVQVSCQSDLTIAGTLPKSQYKSSTWIKTTGFTTSNSGLVLDSDPINGYVLLEPGFEFHSVVSNSNITFLALSKNGCNSTSNPIARFGEYVDSEHVQDANTTASNLLSTANIYPNPSNGEITVEGFSGSFDYQLTDVYGNLVSEGTSEGKLDITALATGSYILSINGHSFKVVKN
jgi:hypothetical protein